MSNLYLYNYNNYFNRIVKKESNLVGYGTPIYSLVATDSKPVNFNYNDGIRTTHDINYPNQDGDYLIVTDNNNNIVSRWFVIESKRTRGGQHRLQLKRDLIADYYNKIINAPMIINRAMVKNTDDPLLYNSEGFSFNQIKRNEILLKDKGNTPWYVLYFKKGVGPFTGSFNPNNISYDEKINTPIAQSIYATATSYIITDAYLYAEYRVEAGAGAGFYWSDEYKMTISEYNINFNYIARSLRTDVLWFDNDSTECQNQLRTAFNGSHSSLLSILNTELGYSTPISRDTYNKLLSMNGRTVLDSDNKKYRITVIANTNTLESFVTSGNFYNEMLRRINTTTLDRTGDPGDEAFSYSEDIVTLSVTATEVTTDSISWSIDWTVDQPTNDSDFNVIAIPYENIYALDTDGGLDYNSYIDSNNSNLLVQSIALVATTNLVDIQLFPYCPIQEALTSTEGHLNLNQIDVKLWYKDTNRKILMLFTQLSNFTFNITQSLEVPEVTGNEILDYKISNECDLYKIVSPNYNGSFEFSVAKNDGVDYFNIDCTLIPYKPYIHVNPNFKSLYGTDWNDSKGLLCGGDFSLPKYTDAWATYQLNNKNYQQIFDRQIRNIDFNFEQERFKTAFGLTAGALAGGVGGAVAGSKFGGPIGAGIGALAGGVASGVGGIMDYSLLSEHQAEQKSLTLDNFNYQLGNIKALPDTINKVTPITFNNKKYPFIEYYSATDKEKSILQNSITFKSMTINAIGTIADYLQNILTYISGNLIRLEELDLNSNEAFEIYNEIVKGVYI